MKIKLILFSFLLSLGLLVNAQDKENNWFIQGQFGASYTLGNQGIGELISPAAQVSFGKYFNPYVGARLAISGFRGRGGHGSNHAGYGFYYGAATIDGLFNMSNIFAGANSDRLFNLSLIAGAGYNQTWEYQVSSFMARAGVQGSIRLNEAISLNMEALANGVSDRWNRQDDHKFDSYYNLLVGITYKFGTSYNFKCPNCEVVTYNNVNEKINEVRNPEVIKEVVTDTITKYVDNTPGIKSHVMFKLAKTNIADDQMMNIISISDYMKEYPESKAIITGYADKGTGTNAINTKLASERANTVADVLTNQYGISSSRITVNSKGDSEQPFKTNDWNRVVIMIAK